MQNKKFNSVQNLDELSKIYNRMVYDFLKEPLFQSFGLELSAVQIKLEDDNGFCRDLKGKTFAYFNPISNSIHVNIQDPFFLNCNNDLERRAKLCFILFHEIYHKVLLHDVRKGNREHNLFNMAADFEVHNMLYLYKECCIKGQGSALQNEFKILENMLDEINKKSFQPDPEHGKYQFCFDKCYLNNTAEEIYADLLKSKKVQSQSFTLDLNSMGGSGQDQDDNNQSGQNSDDNNQAGSDNGSDKDQDDNNQSGQNGNSKKNQKSKSNGNSNNGQNDNHKQVQGQNANGGNGQTNGNGPQVKVTTTTYTLPSGKTFTSTSIQWPDPNECGISKDKQVKDAEARELRRQVMEQNLRKEVERNKGNIGADCMAFLKKLFKVKIDWEKILKTSLQTILTKSDYFSWARPRKTTMTLDLPYLPDVVDDNGAYGKIFITVDQSGSMSDQEFQKIANIILDAKEHYKKIVVLQHDVEINHVFEFDEINEDTLKNVFTRTAAGGTSHHDVFEYIVKDWAETRYDDENKISAVIVCSDCCSDIQDEQKKLPGEIPMIYLVPENCQDYTHGIKGQIIAVE